MARYPPVVFSTTSCLSSGCVAMTCTRRLRSGRPRWTGASASPPIEPPRPRIMVCSSVLDFRLAAQLQTSPSTVFSFPSTSPGEGLATATKIPNSEGCEAHLGTPIEFFPSFSLRHLPLWTGQVSWPRSWLCSQAPRSPPRPRSMRRLGSQG